jgi:cell division protein FtsI (penicillin-binding protein 3)
MKNNRQDKNKLQQTHFIYYLFFVLSLAIIFKIAFFQIKDGKKYKEKANNNSINERDEIPNRGNIYCRNGNMISASLPLYDIGLDFSKNNVSNKDFNEHYDSLAIELAAHFPQKTYEEYKEWMLGLRNQNRQYAYLFRKVNYHERSLVKNFPLLRLGQFQGGYIEHLVEIRTSLYGMLAHRTIGYNREGVSVGLERKYDSILGGKKGKRLKKKMPGGRYVPVNETYIVEPIQGEDIVTTLDMRIQDVAQTTLLEHLQMHDAEWGCAVLMEVSTGEIRAIANLRKRRDGKIVNKKYGIYDEVYNYAVGERYEQGSTMKLFSMMALIEDGKFDPDELVDTSPGYYVLGRDTVWDVHPMGIITAKQIFEHSSNVGTVKLILKNYALQPEVFVQKYIDLKMRELMGIDIDGERGAVIHDISKIPNKISFIGSMSYGYSMSLTPLHVLTYYNAVANNGKMMRPQFVTARQFSGKITETYPPVVLHEKICSDKTIAVLKELLEGVIEFGSARSLRNASCKIAGKTGTSRVVKNDGTYCDKYHNASFAGYFPADNPKYSCIVVISKPNKGMSYGGTVAAPVFKDIAEIVYALEHDMHDSIESKKFVGISSLPQIGKVNTNALRLFLRLMPKEAHSITIPETPWIQVRRDDKIYIEKMSVEEQIMPDVTNMTLRDACYLLESMGCQVKALGTGRVRMQSVAPGSLIENGQKVELTLKK